MKHPLIKSLASAISISILSSLSLSAHAESLSEIYDVAAKNDPLIQEAHANYQSSLQSLDIANSSLLPQINGSLGYNDNDDDISNTSAGISLNQQIYNHGTWLNKSKTEKQIQQALLSYETAQQSLILRTVQTYLDVLKAQDDVEFVKAEKQAIERQLEQTKQRFNVGLTAITDVHEAQAQFDNAMAQEITAKNSVEFALENLRAITGGYYPNLSGLNTDLFSPSQPSPASANEWVAIAENKNKDLTIRKIGKDIAKENIDIASAGHLPSAGLNANYSWSENQQGSSAPTTSQNNLSWGVQVSVPIYSGGRTSAQVDQAKNAFVASAQQLELSYRSAVRSVRNSFNNVNASISRIAALQQTVISAQSALKATKAGFDVGTRTIVDVLNSTRNLYDAKRNLSNARYGYILANLQLKQAAGNLSPTDISLLNRGLSQK